MVTLHRKSSSWVASMLGTRIFKLKSKDDEAPPGELAAWQNG